MEDNISESIPSLPDDIFLYHVFFFLKSIDLYKFKYLNKAFCKILTPDLFRKNIIYHLNKKLKKIFGRSFDSLKKTMIVEKNIIFGEIILKSMLGKEYYAANKKIIKLYNIEKIRVDRNKILKKILKEKYTSEYELRPELKPKTLNFGDENQNNTTILFTHGDENYDKFVRISKLLNEFSSSNNLKKFYRFRQKTFFDIHTNNVLTIKYIGNIDLKYDKKSQKINFLNYKHEFEETDHNILDIIFNENHYFIENGLEKIQINGFNDLMTIMIDGKESLSKLEKLIKKKIFKYLLQDINIERSKIINFFYEFFKNLTK